jgi:hypothetical protein
VTVVEAARLRAFAAIVYEAASTVAAQHGREPGDAPGIVYL